MNTRPRSLLRVYGDIARPFTLLLPALGFVTGAVCAARSLDLAWAPVLLGTLMAASLNIASNALNQICDRRIDAVNKPDRPIPSGRISLGHAWAFTAAFYVLSLLLAWMVVPPCRWARAVEGIPAGWSTRWAVWGAPLAWRECFWVVVAGAVCTYLYSAPPFRTKRHWLLSNITIAIPRGLLLKVAGWAAGGCLALRLAPGAALDGEPWWLGAVFLLYLIGAASTKDFSDIEGDLVDGCVTLPARFGLQRSAWIIAPFLSIPWLLLPAGTFVGLFHASAWAMGGVGVALFLYGLYIAWLILRDPKALALEANHPSWKHMYLLMLVAQLGTAAAYVVAP